MLLKDNVKLNIVYEDDKIEYLKKVGIYDNLTEGKITCRICNTLVTLNNIGKIYKKNGTINIICNSSHCMSKDYRN